MPLGTKVGLGPGQIMLDGDPAPPKEHSLRNFWPKICQTVVHLRYSGTAEHLSDGMISSLLAKIFCDKRLSAQDLL